VIFIPLAKNKQKPLKKTTKIYKKGRFRSFLLKMAQYFSENISEKVYNEQ
jgi:hypothetical protein